MTPPPEPIPYASLAAPRRKRDNPWVAALVVFGPMAFMLLAALATLIWLNL